MDTDLNTQQIIIAKDREKNTIRQIRLLGALYLFNKHKSLRYFMFPRITLVLALYIGIICFRICLDFGQPIGYLSIVLSAPLVITTLLLLRLTINARARVSIGRNMSNHITQLSEKIASNFSTRENQSTVDTIKNYAERFYLDVFTIIHRATYISIIIILICMTTGLTLPLIINMKPDFVNLIDILSRYYIIVTTMLLVNFTLLSILYRLTSIECIYIFFFSICCSLGVLWGLTPSIYKDFLNLQLLTLGFAFLDIFRSRNTFISNLFSGIESWQENQLKFIKLSSFIFFIGSMLTYYSFFFSRKVFALLLLTLFISLIVLIVTYYKSLRSLEMIVMVAGEYYVVYLIVTYSIYLVVGQATLFTFPIIDPSLIHGEQWLFFILVCLTPLLLRLFSGLISNTEITYEFFIGKKGLRSYLVMRAKYILYGFILAIFGLAHPPLLLATILIYDINSFLFSISLKIEEIILYSINVCLGPIIIASSVSRCIIIASPPPQWLLDKLILLSSILLC